MTKGSNILRLGVEPMATHFKASDFERKQLRAIEENREVTPNTIQDIRGLSDLFKEKET